MSNLKKMILATDVFYYDNKAKASGVLFKHWTDPKPYKDFSVIINDVKPYISGKFYQRELPCLLALINAIDEKLDYIIVDGFVFLGKDQKQGLGKYLYDALNQEIPIIGVAKNGFEGTPKSTEILRADSKKPLFITSVGIDLDKAKQHIQKMDGNYRFPTLLKLADHICRAITIQNS